MNIKEYFDIDMRIAMLNVVAGAAAGYVSFVINEPLASFFVAVVAAALLSLSLNNVLKLKKDTKWWISNGLLIFILVWFVSWTLFYDMRLLATLPR